LWIFRRFCGFSTFIGEASLIGFVRRQLLMDLLYKQPGIRATELANTLGVSQGTVRNDLKLLEQEGLILRKHGGAVLKEIDPLQNNSFLIRYRDDADAKRAIAHAAAEMVKNNDSILIDASSTSYYFAQAVVTRQRLRIVTNGIDVARLLALNSSNTVILIGGVVNNDAASVTGPLSELFMQELRIQNAFVSCSGFSLGRGLTEVNLAEAQVKRMAIESCQQVIAMVDSTKFGREDLTSFARPERIKHIFTDWRLSPEWAERLAAKGIEFTICRQDDMDKNERINP
jgi:DeoR/GlpR family transcriptional regulator of sugar metabolism